MRPPALHTLRDIQHKRQVVIASDERGHEPVRREAAQCGGTVMGAQQAVDGEGFGLALQGEVSARLERERVLGQQEGCAAYHRLPRPGGRLQARGHVHRVAGDGIGRVRRRPEIAGHHPTRIDTDVQRDRVAEAMVPALAERDSGRMHVECRVHGALRVVFMRHRCTENRHHRVTDEFLDERVVALDHPAQSAKQVRLQCAHVLGIQPLGDRGEAGQVREKHAGRPAIRVRHDGWRRDRWGQFAPASRTESEVSGYVELAVCALHRPMPRVVAASSRAEPHLSNTAKVHTLSRLPKIVVVLHGQPAFGRAPHGFAEAQSHFGTDATVALEHTAQRGGRNP